MLDFGEFVGFRLEKCFQQDLIKLFIYINIFTKDVADIKSSRYDLVVLGAIL